MKLTIKPEWRWIAKDQDGDVWVYRTKPTRESDGWQELRCYDVSGIFDIPDIGEWEDSLHEIMPDGTLGKNQS